MAGGHDAALTLDPHPGSTSGHVGGVIELPAGATRASMFTVELYCTEYRHGTSSSSNRSSVIWQDVAMFPAERHADGSLHVPFCFYLPEEAPQTSERDAGSSEPREWTLRVSSRLSEVDFSRHWQIPVSASGVHASPPLAFLAIAPSTRAGADTQLQVQRESTGVTLLYPPGRSGRAVPFLIVFGLCFCGAAAFLAHVGEIFMMLAFGTFGLGTLAGSLWLAGNALRVQLRDRTLSIRRELFGVPISRRELPLSLVAGVTGVKGSYSEQNPSSLRIYYNLVAQLRDGERFVIGEGFVGYSEVMSGARRFAQLSGLPVLGGPPAVAQPDVQASVRADATAPPLLATRTLADRLVEGGSAWSYLSPALAAVIFLALGAAFGGVQHARVVAFGARTNGTIVGYNEKHDTTYKRRGTSSSRTTYAPVVRFDLAGNSYTFEHWWSRNSPPTIGAPVFVRYDSTHPEHAMIDDGMRLWIPWAPLFALGALLMFDALRRWLARLRSG